MDNYSFHNWEVSVMGLTEEQALRAYATMINKLDVSFLEPLLADDFHYASQWVLTEIESKDAFLKYITVKLEAIRNSGATAWAEMGWLDGDLTGPCVVMAQGDKDNLVTVVLAKVRNGAVTRLDICGAPSPRSARRSGDYPGFDHQR
jgi:hypothetical protein